MGGVRIGLVGGLGWPHAKQVASQVNALGAHIATVWDPDEKNVAEFVERFGINEVAPRPEAMIGTVDGVIVADDTSCVHGKLALPFLDAGVPTFVDKPLATTVSEAVALVKRAERGGAPLMSVSALRYANAVRQYRDEADRLGAAKSMVAVGTNVNDRPFHFYGIHATQLLVAVMGVGVTAVQALDNQDQRILKLRYPDGRSATIVLVEGYRSYVLTGHFDGGTRVYEVGADPERFNRMVADIVTMIRTKRAPEIMHETLETIRILSAAEESRASGDEVRVSHEGV